MEAVLDDFNPLATYLLEGQAGREDDDCSSDPEQDVSPSPSFAPRGNPMPRHKLPSALQLTARRHAFLEEFRFIIISSRLLHKTYGYTRDSAPLSEPQLQNFKPDLLGATISSCAAFAFVWLVRVSAYRALLAAVSVTMVVVSIMRKVQHLRQRPIVELRRFVSTAYKLQSAIEHTISYIAEVELVSRGYSISIPLPPITRLEDPSQRRCKKLREQLLRNCFARIFPRYIQACASLKALIKEVDLEKYCEIYDISDYDSAYAMSGYSETEFDDPESVRVFKILAARYHTSRQVFLCSLLAMDASSSIADLKRWDIVVREIREICVVNQAAADSLQSTLSEEESFPVPATPKLPLSPGRERWRAQLRKLNSLSSGIRGLQAKMHVLREESDRHLDESVDVSELGTDLMLQYESVGVDLKALMQEWEDGKAALASNIDRNERRISSMSGMLSPTSSIGGLTAVDEGGALDALKALNGDARSRSSMDFTSDVEEVFEAISVPRQRSILPREERIIKMKEDRVKRDSMKSNKEANTKMLRELQSVINMRPRGKTAPGARVTSI